MGFGSIPIVFATDHNFVMPLGVAISSLLRHTSGEKYDLNIIVDEDVTDSDKKKLEEQVKLLSEESTITFVEIDNKFNKSHTDRNITRATYFRLMIPWLLPQYAKVFYADCDVIFRGSLREIYENMNLEECYVAGVNMTVFGTDKFNKYCRESLGLDSQEYINPGLLLINADLQRRDNLLPRYVELSARRFKYMDQDIINVVCRGKVRFLPIIYNVDCRNDSAEDISNYVMLHYVGRKPWDNYVPGFVEWWDEYRSSTFHDRAFYVDVMRKITSRWDEMASCTEQLNSPEVQSLLSFKVYHGSTLRFWQKFFDCKLCVVKWLTGQH